MVKGIIDTSTDTDFDERRVNPLQVRVNPREYDSFDDRRMVRGKFKKVSSTDAIFDIDEQPTPQFVTDILEEGPKANRGAMAVAKE